MSDARVEATRARAVVCDAALDLSSIGAVRFARARTATAAFFDANADRVPAACEEMARRFCRGGRLLAWGAGAAASDASHVAVEFVHPVVVGKRALPALALGERPLADLQLLGRECDLVMVIASAGGADTAALLLDRARAGGLLTLHLAGGAGGLASPAADFTFAVAEEDPTVVQEVHETLYHVLWELVHVFLEQGDRC